MCPLLTALYRKSLLGFILLSVNPVDYAQSENAIQSIAFGSCLRQDRPAPILTTLAKFNPDVFIAMGDNIYGDTEDMDILAARYQQARKLPGYAVLRKNTAFLGYLGRSRFRSE